MYSGLQVRHEVLKVHVRLLQLRLHLARLGGRQLVRRGQATQVREPLGDGRPTRVGRRRGQYQVLQRAIRLGERPQQLSDAGLIKNRAELVR